MQTEAPRPRDREATQKAILAAAKEVLAEEGFQGFGVNAVARRAGCDKQLIYRYFSGIDGLLDAIGIDLAAWLQERLRENGTVPATYAEFVETMVVTLIDALRADPLILRIAAWELAAPSPQVSRLTQARGQVLGKWVVELRGSLTPPPGVDFGAINASLFAAAQHLALAGWASKQYAGAPLESEEDWARMREALRMLVRGVYGLG